MKITLDNTELKALVRGLGKVILRNTSLPALDQVLFRGTEGAVEAVATDLDQTLVCRLDDALETESGPDAFLFPFAELGRLSKSMKRHDAVSLAPDTDDTVIVTATIEGQSLESRVTPMPVAEFPEAIKSIDCQACDVSPLLAALRTTLRFASTDETRHVLGGVFWHHEEGVLAATDGRRLALFRMADLPLDGDLIIPPSKVLRTGLLSGEDGAVGVLSVDDVQYLEIRAGQWRWQTRCIDGTYPNYRQVIPSEDAPCPGTVFFAPEDLGLVKTAVTQFTDRENTTIYVYGSSDAVILLGSPSEDSSRAHVQLPHSTCTAETPVAQAVNAQFLLDGLEAGFTTVRLSENAGPWRCTGEGVDGLHVVMPMRMDEDEKQSIIESVAGNVAATPKGEDTVSEQQRTAGDASGEEQQAGPKRTPAHKPDLKIVTVDPLQEVLDAITTAQESVQSANSAVRGLKSKVRALDRHFKAREKEFEATGRLLTKLKEAASF